MPHAVTYWRSFCCWRWRRLFYKPTFGDVADSFMIGLRSPASEIAVLRERIVRLNDALTGHRLLRGAIHPGGVSICRPREIPRGRHRPGEHRRAVPRRRGQAGSCEPLLSCTRHFNRCSDRNRSQEARSDWLGLPARASGLWRQDFRLRHPQAAYATSEVEPDAKRTRLPNYSRAF